MNRLDRMSAASVAAVVFAGLSASAVSAATVSGSVNRADIPNNAIADARVTLFVEDLSFFREVRTDASGQFVFEDVPSGSYRLGVSKLNRAYDEVAVDAGPGETTIDFTLGPEVEPGRWDVIGTTAPEFLDATDIGVLLPDGRIFYCHNTTDPIVFDPITGAKTFPSGSPTASGCMNGTTLADGRIIVVGGQNGSDPGDFELAVPWVKTYRPQDDTWQLLSDLRHRAGRWYPGLARLADGSLLVMGGGTCCNAERTETCERFDLDTETWSYTGSLLNPAEFPPSALLYTGEVLATWWPPQLYNSVTGLWRPTGNFNQPNRLWPGHSDHSLIVLADGRALAVGVIGGPNQNAVMGEIYDPSTELWNLTSNPGLVRFQTEVVQLPDGRVLVAGGETETKPPPVDDVLGIVRWCDLYDVNRDAWRRVADMIWHREYHAVTLLVPDGRVVTTGGTRIKFQVGPTTADIEAYSPPYLLRGVRPQITGVSTTEPRRGDLITMQIFPATRLTGVVLTGAQTTTHWVDGGIPRRLVLPVEQDGPTATAPLPLDANLLPLGRYMLFAMVDDIPSRAVMVMVKAALGDADSDGDVDLFDVGAYLECVTGPGGVASETCAQVFDGDSDLDVDFADFAALQTAVSE